MDTSIIVSQDRFGISPFRGDFLDSVTGCGHVLRQSLRHKDRLLFEISQTRVSDVGNRTSTCPLLEGLGSMEVTGDGHFAGQCHWPQGRVRRQRAYHDVGTHERFVTISYASTSPRMVASSSKRNFNGLHENLSLTSVVESAQRLLRSGTFGILAVLEVQEKLSLQSGSPILSLMSWSSVWEQVPVWVCSRTSLRFTEHSADSAHLAIRHHCFSHRVMDITSAFSLVGSSSLDLGCPADRLFPHPLTNICAQSSIHYRGRPVLVTFEFVLFILPKSTCKLECSTIWFFPEMCCGLHGRFRLPRPVSLAACAGHISFHWYASTVHQQGVHVHLGWFAPLMGHPCLFPWCHFPSLCHFKASSSKVEISQMSFHEYSFLRDSHAFVQSEYFVVNWVIHYVAYVPSVPSKSLPRVSGYFFLLRVVRSDFRSRVFARGGYSCVKVVMHGRYGLSASTWPRTCSWIQRPLVSSGIEGMATERGGCRALESGPFSAGGVFPSQVQTQLGQRQSILVVECL